MNTQQVNEANDITHIAFTQNIETGEDNWWDITDVELKKAIASIRLFGEFFLYAAPIVEIRYSYDAECDACWPVYTLGNGDEYAPQYR